MIWPVAMARGDYVEVPTFRTGLWQFERIVAQGAVTPIFADATFAVKQRSTRCVDPNVAMQEVFGSRTVGNCRPATPIKIANRYVFAKRCDFAGPVRTLIEVESDAAYVEINESTASNPLRTEIIIARRIGDCSDQQ
jgi:hypothetical protein